VPKKNKTCSLTEEKKRGTVFINSYSDHNEKGNYVFFYFICYIMAIKLSKMLFSTLLNDTKKRFKLVKLFNTD
jgi:hypothetical protein